MSNNSQTIRQTYYENVQAILEVNFTILLSNLEINIEKIKMTAWLAWLRQMFFENSHATLLNVDERLELLRDKKNRALIKWDSPNSFKCLHFLVLTNFAEILGKKWRELNLFLYKIRNSLFICFKKKLI